jgi:hypothetical protein
MAGLFEEQARREAVKGALPLLAGYFVGGDSWRLRPQEALDAGVETDRELAQAVRLRVLLALGRSLVAVVEAITEQPSFRYGRRSEHSVGVVAGRLDVPRYLRDRGQVQSPRRYPIHQVERHLATPENLLTVAALEALGRELARAPAHVLARAGPESRELAELQAALARLGQLPTLAPLRPEGRRNADRRHLELRRDQVVRRLERREIARPEPYEALVGWTGELLEGRSADPGSQAWAFYEESFDERLFEIWLLQSVRQALSARYGAPVDGRFRPLWERDEKPQAVWETPAGKIELFVQKEATTLGLKGRWGVPEREHRLGAKPDMVLRLRTPDRSRCLVVDAKLRRGKPLPRTEAERLNLPSEEIYKMLGYFEHLSLQPGPTGALVFYTPGFGRSATLEAAAGDGRSKGTLLLAGVDPAQGRDSREALETIVDLVAELLGEPSEAALKEAEQLALEARAAGGDAAEAAAVRMGRIYTEIAAGYQQRHPEQLQTVEATTRASFAPATWSSLEEDSRRMLVSAEMYALHQEEEMDFSGPLLVLCTACERELNRRLFAPLAATAEEGASLLPAHPPLGTGIYVMRKAAELLKAEEQGRTQKLEEILEGAKEEDEAASWRAMAGFLKEAGHTPKKLFSVVESLSSLNSRYRRRSAHDEPTERSLWIAGRGKIFGPEGLLGLIASTFERERRDSNPRPPA